MELGKTLEKQPPGWVEKHAESSESWRDLHSANETGSQLREASSEPRSLVSWWAHSAPDLC